MKTQSQFQTGRDTHIHICIYMYKYARTEIRTEMPIRSVLTWGTDAQSRRENEREPSVGELSSDSACTNLLKPWTRDVPTESENQKKSESQSVIKMKMKIKIDINVGRQKEKEIERGRYL